MIKGMQEIELSKLTRANWNYKEDDPVLKNILIENLRKNGQIENLIVRQLDDGRFEVVNGNHRFDALTELGVKAVICFNLGSITTEEAKRIAIETNEIEFKTDILKLADIIKDLATYTPIEDLAKTMPYSVSELTDFIGMTEFNWQDYEQPNKPPPPAQNISTTIAITNRLLSSWTEWLSHCPPDTSNEDALLLLLKVGLASEGEKDTTSNT